MNPIPLEPPLFWEARMLGGYDAANRFKPSATLKPYKHC
jgi:hypothetical protein